MLRSLSGLPRVARLKNSDDQGVKVDLLAEVYKNSEKIAEGLVRCITGLTRDPGRAKEVVVVPTLGSAQTFNGDTDKLSVKLLTRIGTNPDDTKCAGSHASAVGLRAYFDAVGRASRLDAAAGGELKGLRAAGQTTRRSGWWLRSRRASTRRCSRRRRAVSCSTVATGTAMIMPSTPSAWLPTTTEPSSSAGWR